VREQPVVGGSSQWWPEETRRLRAGGRRRRRPTNDVRGAIMNRREATHTAALETQTTGLLLAAAEMSLASTHITHHKSCAQQKISTWSYMYAVVRS
jgi:hypothetical protein